MLFNTTVVRVFIYGVEVWGDIISLRAWNEIDKIQKIISWELNPQHPVLCFRNTCPTHRVANQKVYKQITKLTQSQIAKTGLEHRMQGTKH